MPLIRRLPKRGFNNAAHTTRYVGVNVSSLERFDADTTVDLAVIRSAGLANGPVELVKILGNGELTKKVNVRAHAFSASAREKIEAAGGTCVVIDTGRKVEG